MYTIPVHFRRFSDLHLGDLIGATGIYVIWDANAVYKPTYIGEGIVLKRLSDHTARDFRRFARPWDGYVALFEANTSGVLKLASQIAEKLLLDVGFTTDRFPSANRSRGSTAAVTGVLKHEAIKVSVRGFDPYSDPALGRRLSGSRSIRARPEAGRSYWIEHDWRLRRIGRPLGGRAS